MSAQALGTVLSASGSYTWGIGVLEGWPRRTQPPPNAQDSKKRPTVDQAKARNKVIQQLAEELGLSDEEVGNADEHGCVKQRACSRAL
jgi:hypothetical protein